MHRSQSHKTHVERTLENKNSETKAVKQSEVHPRDENQQHFLQKDIEFVKNATLAMKCSKFITTLGKKAECINKMQTENSNKPPTK